MRRRQPGIADLYAALIAAGHRHADLAGYTWRQMKLYLRAAARRERSDQAQFIQSIQLALSKDGNKAVKKLLDD